MFFCALPIGINYRALQPYYGMYYNTSIENLLLDEVKNPIHSYLLYNKQWYTCNNYSRSVEVEKHIQ